MAEIEVLLEMDPADLPVESKFLLEIDYSSLLRSSFERQSYWVRAMKAARHAGRRVATLQRNNGAAARRRQAQRASNRTGTKAITSVKPHIDESHSGHDSYGAADIQ